MAGDTHRERTMAPLRHHELPLTAVFNIICVEVDVSKNGSTPKDSLKMVADVDRIFW